MNIITSVSASTFSDLAYPEIPRLRVDNPAYENMRRLSERGGSISVTDFLDHTNRFGFGLLTEPAIEIITQTLSETNQSIISVGTGLGYAEAQLEARGLSVVGFDTTIAPHRWLADTRHGPAGIDLHEWQNSALFMSFPDRSARGESFSEAIVSKFCEVGGSLIIVVSEKRLDRHIFGSDRALYETLARFQRANAIDLPAWPELDTLRLPFRGHGGYLTLEPELCVYRVPER